MGSADDAQKAIRALNDSELDGRNIVVNEAKSRD
jgi:RNA recognition motif-containing protein